MWRVRQATLSDTPALVRLWNAAAGQHFPISERLLFARTEADPDFSWEFSRVAMHENEMIGLCLATRSAPGLRRPSGWADKAWIKLIAVAPEYQRRGIGTQLLADSESALLATGNIGTICAGTDPFHLFPGPPDDSEAAQPFFANRGYELAGSAWDLTRDVADFVVPQRVNALLEDLAPELRIVNAEDQHGQAICRFLEREFPGGWYYYSRLYLASGQNPQDFVIILQGDDVEGFCHTSHYRSPHYLGNTLWHPALGDHFGGLGPIGVSAARRGEGLGLALLCKSVEYLRDLGVRNMCIDWTGLVDFYGKIGFKPWRHYRHATKRLS